MRKIILFMLVVVMIITLTACKTNNTHDSLEGVNQLAEQEIPAIDLMLGCEWDAENLPDSDYLMIANAAALYKRDTGEEMPFIFVPQDDNLVNQCYKIDDLIPVITKYFPFSENLLRDSFINSSLYDAQNDAVVLMDGWGWNIYPSIHGITDNQDGTFDIAYGMYDGGAGSLEYKGVVKAKLYPDGYMQFLSNVIIPTNNAN